MTRIGRMKSKLSPLSRLAAAEDDDARAAALGDLAKEVEEGRVSLAFISGQKDATSPGWLLAAQVIEAAKDSTSFEVVEGAISSVLLGISRRPEGVNLALEGLLDLALTTSRPQTAAAAIGTARMIFEENPAFPGIGIFTLMFSHVTGNDKLRDHFTHQASPIPGELARMQKVCADLATARRQAQTSRADTQPRMEKVTL
jgi:hypothetical protein